MPARSQKNTAQLLARIPRQATGSIVLTLTKPEAAPVGLACWLAAAVAGEERGNAKSKPFNFRQARLLDAGSTTDLQGGCRPSWSLPGGRFLISKMIPTLPHCWKNEW